VLKLTRPTDNETEDTIFDTRACFLIFAAAYGASRGLHVPVMNPSNSPEPIRYDVFENKGYEPLINLIAVYHNKEALQSLDDNDAAEDSRVDIFESYANGGLLELKQKLNPYPDKLEGLQMILNKHRDQAEPAPIDFNNI
jgi:dnd system-associated protein 4